MSAPVLAITDLAVAFDTLRGPVRVLDGVSLSIGAGEILGVVGESGSGKSVTALAAMGLLGETGRIGAGRIALAGREVTGLGPKDWQRLRGREIGMIFQEPTTSLNPLFAVGFQIAEVLIAHLGLSRAEARARAVEMMARVGIADAAARAGDYPHQMSGGMKQRIMIAMALACHPKILIADEPTTALDVTIQAQILELIRDLRAEFGMAVLLITHDMGVVAETADRVAVMYAGQIVEEAPVEALFDNPAHPYTRLLLRAIPSARGGQDVLPVIEGTAPAPDAFPPGCRFAPRCPLAEPACGAAVPALVATGPARRARCIRLDAARDLFAQQGGGAG